jgi:hypothetical protein
MSFGLIHLETLIGLDIAAGYGFNDQFRLLLGGFLYQRFAVLFVEN